MTSEYLQWFNCGFTVFWDNIMLKVDKAGTKQRLRTFRESLLASLDENQLKQFDEYVKLSTKIVRFSLYLLLFLGLLPEYEIIVKILSTVTLALVYLALEILYHYADIRVAFDAKIQAVVFSIFALWYACTYSFLVFLGIFIKSIWISIIWTLAMVLGAIILREIVENWLMDKVSSVVKHVMRPFEEVITLTALRYYRKAIFSASVIIGSLVFAFFVTWLQSSVLWLSFVLVCVAVFFAIDFIRIDKFTESIDLLWIVNERWTTDLMTYSLDLCNSLADAGIVGYNVVLRLGKCFNISDLPDVNPAYLIGTSLILPQNNAPVILLHPVEMKVDIMKVMAYLNEKWNRFVTSKTQEGTLSTVPPFFFPDARVLVKSALVQMERVAWVSGNPCFGLELAGEDLLKISSNVGQFAR